MLLAEVLDHVEVGGFADHDAGFLEVVEREIGFFAEDADFSFGFEGEAGGGEVGDAAVFEDEADAGDVFVLSEDIDTDGVDVLDGALGEGEDDVDIMDHDVEHDADVGGAEGVRRDALGFHKAGLDFEPVHGLADGVEAFGIADLQGAVIVAGQLEHVPSLGQREGEGFFDEHGDLAGEERFGDGGVVLGGYRDGYGVNLVEQLGGVTVGGGLVLLGQFAVAVLVEINDADEFDLFHFAVYAAVEAAHFAGADNGGSEFFH